MTLAPGLFARIDGRELSVAGALRVLGKGVDGSKGGSRTNVPSTLAPGLFVRIDGRELSVSGSVSRLEGKGW